MNKKMHLLIISQYFFPEQFRINDICLELKKKNYEITVLTGIPNYPNGKFYKGYGLFKRRIESWNGVRVIRIPIIPRGHSRIQLVLNYYSFVAAGWFWTRFTKLQADGVFSFEVSPMLQVLVGKWYSERKKIPHCAYIQDIWPDNLEIVGGIHNKTILNHYQKLADKLYRSCSTILTTSPSFAETIRYRVIDKSKVIYFPQYAEDCYKPQVRKRIPEIPDNPKFKVVFTGNIGDAQGLDVLPKVAELLPKDICFVIVGDGRYKAQLLADTKRFGDRFIFIQSRPPEDIPTLLAACDVAFLSLLNDPLLGKTIPAKLQSYMACGMPIVASALGEVRRIITEAKCGVCCDPENVRQLADAIILLKTSELSEMRKNSLEYAKAHFNKERLITQLDMILAGEQKGDDRTARNDYI